MQLKPWIKNMVRAVAFTLALLAAVTLVGHYLMPHSNRYLTGYTAGGILGEDFDTIDVLVMGDSNAAQGISPMEWYNTYGVTGYTYATGWMSVFTIYYRLLNIYEEQAPRVVILTTAPIFSQKPNATYFESAAGDISEELLPLLRFHDNWKTLTWTDLTQQNDYTWRDVNKGYTPITDVGAYMNGDYMYNTNTTEDIPLLTRIYLGRIAALCEEHGSELVLFTVPCAADWNLARHNAVQEYADENGITYIDYNMAAAPIEMDWRTDTPDGGVHLNLIGARKVSDALGRFITENFTLEDHRGQPGYEDWDADAAEYTEVMTKAYARNEENAAYQLEVLGESA